MLVEREYPSFALVADDSVRLQGEQGRRGQSDGPGSSLIQTLSFDSTSPNSFHVPLAKLASRTAWIG
jgi:hypothetical protein